jgi:hypothetical protein
MTLRAPLSAILPSTIPTLLEKGVPGYVAAPTIATNERKLSEEEVRPVIAAAVFLGALNYVGSKGFNLRAVEAAFDRSLNQVMALSEAERESVRALLRRFRSFKIIRETHAFDDWICESWWVDYQNAEYEYPSQMANAIAYDLDVKRILERCLLEEG